MSNYGLYVYGIMRENNDSALSGIRGVDETHSLMAITTGEFHAIASPVDLTEFGECEISERLQNMHWVEGKTKRHFEILQQLTSIGIIVPVKFCTVFIHAERLKAFLNAHTAYLQEAFSCFQNKEEWVLKMIRDSTHYSGGNINQMVQDNITETLSAFWKELGTKVEKTKLKGSLFVPSAEDREKPLLKSVLLIRKEEVPGVIQWVKDQDKKLETFSLKAELSGPLPFYNFAELFIP